MPSIHKLKAQFTQQVANAAKGHAAAIPSPWFGRFGVVLIVYLHDAHSISMPILEISVVMRAYWLISLPRGWTRLRRDNTTIKLQGRHRCRRPTTQSRRHDPKGYIVPVRLKKFRGIRSNLWECKQWFSSINSKSGPAGLCASRTAPYTQVI